MWKLYFATEIMYFKTIPFLCVKKKEKEFRTCTRTKKERKTAFSSFWQREEEKGRRKVEVGGESLDVIPMGALHVCQIALFTPPLLLLPLPPSFLYRTDYNGGHQTDFRACLHYKSDYHILRAPKSKLREDLRSINNIKAFVMDTFECQSVQIRLWTNMKGRCWGYRT